MFLKIFGIAIGIIILVLGGIATYVYFTAPDRYNILVVGSDQRGSEAARSDVLMVFSVPKAKDGTINLLTIPRDSRVEVEGYGPQKITHAYGFDKEPGALLGNIDLTKQTVEDLLGLEIHTTVEFTFNSFTDFIDSNGGVEGPEGITLDGEEALAIVRDRARAGGDFARTSDQREILKSLLPLVSTKSGLTDTIDFFNGHPESRLNLGLRELVKFGFAYVVSHRSLAIPSTDIEDYVVPGENARIYTEAFGKELYYWVIDEKGLKELIDEYFI